MSESARMWMEIGFNVTYLIVIWGLVVAMWLRRDNGAADERRLRRLLIAAFALLALGDTGHVGFRVWAYARGDLGSTVSLGGLHIGLVGVGALATAITVTFFYVFVLMIWRARFAQRYGWVGILLLSAAVVRLLLMALPQNEWNSSVPLQPWSTLRNLPLILQGLGVAYLIVRDAHAAGDRTFFWIGLSILVSYAFYMPVIFLVQRYPLVGMLMIPKTMAYVAIALLGYQGLFRQPAAREGRPALA